MTERGVGSCRRLRVAGLRARGEPGGGRAGGRVEHREVRGPRLGARAGGGASAGPAAHRPARAQAGDACGARSRPSSCSCSAPPRGRESARAARRADGRPGLQVRDVTVERVAICLMGRAGREVLGRVGTREVAEGAVRSESARGYRRWCCASTPGAGCSSRRPRRRRVWNALSEAGAPLGLPIGRRRAPASARRRRRLVPERH